MGKTVEISSKRIKEIVCEKRKQFNGSILRKFNALNAFKDLEGQHKIIVKKVDGDAFLRMQDFPARYEENTNTIVILKETYNLDNSIPFTTNYYLCSLLFNYIQSRELHLDISQTSRCKLCADSQWQACEFASELLFPSELSDEKEEDLINLLQLDAYFINYRKMVLNKRSKEGYRDEFSFVSPLTKCPKCGHYLKEVVYGMVAYIDQNRYVGGGCYFDEDSTHKYYCSFCEEEIKTNKRNNRLPIL